MTVTCAIHQPNFFPWLGYFDKINQADVFVFLDEVQNQKTGSNWVNRTKLNCHGSDKWFTCAIKRPSGVVNINHVEFADGDWQQKFIAVLENYYQKYPNYMEVFEFINSLLKKQNSNFLYDFNIQAIKAVSKKLGIESKFIMQSELNVDGKSNDLLINICKQVGADKYLCGGGAGSYQDDQLFFDNNIEVMYQKYSLKPYGDPEKFISGLSVIDYFMEKGV